MKQTNGDISKYLSARQVVELVESTNSGQVWIAGHFGGVSKVKSPRNKQAWLYHPDILDVLTNPDRLAAAKKAGALHYQVKNAKDAKPAALPPPAIPAPAFWLDQLKALIPAGWDISAETSWKNGELSVRSVTIAPKVGGK